ncbi:MAG: hypothetical protein H6765_10235 [Candidatus Peribacteria bacterium]|nr:MAG: hypothetical protein H6765_10235 [Candidatus Peribacteria bacterium]
MLSGSTIYYTLSGSVPTADITIEDVISGGTFNPGTLSTGGAISVSGYSFTSTGLTIQFSATTGENVNTSFVFTYQGTAPFGGNTQVCNSATLDVGGSFTELSDDGNTDTPDTQTCVYGYDLVINK